VEEAGAGGAAVGRMACNAEQLALKISGAIDNQLKKNKRKMSRFLFPDDSFEAVSMEESAEDEVQIPILACDYVDAPATAKSVCEQRYRRGCSPEDAKCKNGNPADAWNNKYSVCRGGLGRGSSGDIDDRNACPCYWEKASRSGFELGCNLYPGFHIDRRNIWNIEYMNELRRSLGIPI